MREKGGPQRFSETSAANKVVDPENQQLETSFTDLPSDITTQILLRLPLTSILKCKCVCRSLKSLISCPKFTNQHFKDAQPGVMIRTNDSERGSRTLHLLDELKKFENDGDEETNEFCGCYDNFTSPGCNIHLKLQSKFKLPFHDGKYGVVNSCNGLLCLCDPLSMNPLVVSNPITGEFISLPYSSRIDDVKHESCLERETLYSGFGFQPKTNEYKVLRILKEWPKISFLGHCVDLVVQVHTLGTSTWKNVDVDPSFSIRCLTFPTYVNGVVHWIISRVQIGSILCFNFESEIFETLPPPPGVFKNSRLQDFDRISMGELRGFMYICDSSYVDTPVIMWIMKEYGIEESWTKAFSIDIRDGHSWPLGGLYWPVKHFEKDDSILMYHSLNCFIYYEPKKSGFKYFKVRGTPSKFEAIPHIPSLISLKDVVKEEDNIKVFNVHSRFAEHSWMMRMKKHLLGDVYPPNLIYEPRMIDSWLPAVGCFGKPKKAENEVLYLAKEILDRETAFQGAFRRE